MTQPRDPGMIQREIEETRANLARTLDELAERANPRRVASRGVSALSESTRARAIIGAGAGLILALVALRIIRRLRD
ncbi:MAG: DUF3618 domain-containing protein [Actinomycetota bacterium]|nr:DUF3618 domain-containing protein [Actinomycetota bacterium]